MKDSLAPRRSDEVCSREKFLEGSRYKTIKTGYNRGHSERPHPFQNGVLQYPLVLSPGGWERATKAAKVAHAIPGQEGWAGKVGCEVCLGASPFLKSVQISLEYSVDDRR